MAETEKLFCDRCKKTMSSREFYKTNNLIKYPSGWLNKCKYCITAHVDNWDPNTYLWILEELDIPYVPKEWDSLLATNIKINAGPTQRFFVVLKKKECVKQWQNKDIQVPK